MNIKIIVLTGVALLSTLPAQADPPALSDVITFANGQGIRGRSTAGRFPPVALNRLETASIKLQFAATMAGTPVIIQALDGGGLGLAADSAAIALDGTTSFQFQVADQPGLYRVLVIAGQAVSMVQFEVPPQGPEE
jgi:hypothetical protein